LLKLHKDHILVIGDTHIPFCHPGYLDFCIDIQHRVKCKTIVHIGDLCDLHSISYHEVEPDGWSPADEMAQADKHLVKWFRAFKDYKVYITKGNHDRLPDRKRKTAGLPSRCFQSFRKIWNLPNNWSDDFEFELYGVRFIHGCGYSGKYAHIQAAYDSRQSCVMGHIHSSAGVEYIANNKDCIYGMNVGCGISKSGYTFAYGRDFRFKPILSAGVITDAGAYAQVFKMPL